MRMMGGVVVVLLVLASAHAEVLCVHFKKDGTLTGAIKVRTACKRREVQVDAPMLGLCCDGSTTTTTSTTTTIDTGFTTMTTMPFFTTTTSPAPTTSTSLPVSTTTTMPGATTSTSLPTTTTSSTSPPTTTTSSTAPAQTTTITIVPTTSTSTSTSLTTTTSLFCPTITSTTLPGNICGGNPPSCNGFCSNARACVTPDGISCQCVGAVQPCGPVTKTGTCGGTCPAGMVCSQTINVGQDGCPESYGCGCVPG